MGTETLEQRNDGTVIRASHINSISDALKIDIVPRDGTGAAVGAAGSLGQDSLRFDNTYTGKCYIGATGSHSIEHDGVGMVFKLDGIEAYRIDEGGATSTQKVGPKEGKTSSISDAPDFLRAGGTGNAFTLLADPDFKFLYNGGEGTVANDLPMTMDLGFSVNRLGTYSELPGVFYPTDGRKVLGERGKARNSILLQLSDGGASSEFNNYLNEVVAWKLGSELSIGRVVSVDSVNIRLEDCYRGYFRNPSGDQTLREDLDANDTIEILRTAWVFLDYTNTENITYELSYLTPERGQEPTAPAENKLWYDADNKLWKKRVAAAWVDQKLTLIGMACADATDVLGTRSFDFIGNHTTNDPLPVVISDSVEKKIETINDNFNYTVYGNTFIHNNQFFEWDLDDDFVRGGGIQNATKYFIYIKDDGAPAVETEAPHDRTHDLKGWYHPHESWWYVATIDVTAGGWIILGSGENYNVYNNNGTFIIPLNTKTIKVVGCGGGGGGGMGARFFSNMWSGSGGGGAGYGEEVFDVSNNPLSSVDIIVGDGGAGGYWNGSTVIVGEDGELSSAIGGGVNFSVAGGGGSQEVTIGSSGGFGAGVGGGGDGGRGGSQADTDQAADGQAGTPYSPYASLGGLRDHIYGGGGGGGGAFGNGADASTPGNDGLTPEANSGAGASGASARSSGADIMHAGGAGGSGKIIIFY